MESLLYQFEDEKEIRKKKIPPRSAAIGIRSNDIVARVAYIKVLNQHFYKLLSIHRLEGGGIYIYIYVSEGVRSFEERGEQDDGGHNFTTAILSASNVGWKEWWQSITFIVESVLSRSDIHYSFVHSRMILEDEEERVSFEKYNISTIL